MASGGNFLSGVETWHDKRERATMVRGCIRDKDVLNAGPMLNDTLAWQIQHQISLAIAERVMLRVGPLIDAAVDTVLKEMGECDGSKATTA